MKLSEISEFGLIDLLAGLIEKKQPKDDIVRKQLVVGIGGDAAAWKNSGRLTLATTDCLVEGVHFKAGQGSWADLGWKALAVNLSDIAAMGGVPEYALVTLGLPEDTQVEDITELYEGMIEAGNQYGVAIAGGDTTSSDTLFISLIVTGSSGGRLLLRSAARPGDMIAVTSYPGMAAAGMALIDSKAAPSDRNLPLRQAFLRPSPRLAEGKLILSAGGHAAIDVSDGLIADLGHICHASKVGAVVRTSDIPIHPALLELFPARSLDMALGGGEDYELIFSASAATVEKVKAKSATPVSVIGKIISSHPGCVQILDANGKDYSLKKPGWDHFTHA